MNALYECSIAHCRLKPKKHAFSYRVFMFCVELNDLPKLDQNLTAFSHNRFNLFSIDDQDHIDLGCQGIRGNLIEWLSRQNINCPDDVRVQLVTFPRVFGYGFNPVSFYYVFTNSGDPFVAVAEVVNTFREMKLYLINDLQSDAIWHRRVSKNFYVSPFSDPGDEFCFRLGLPTKSWQVNIDDISAGDLRLISSVRGEQRSLTSARLLWYGVKYPFLSLKIIGLIHWHALLLWIKRVPYFRKTERTEVQLEILRPHSTTHDIPR